jgi:hypothetical protein
MTKTSVVSMGSFGFVALVGSQTRRTGRLLYKSNSGSLPGKAGGSPIDLSAAKIQCKLAAVDHSLIRLALEFLGIPWDCFYSRIAPFYLELPCHANWGRFSSWIRGGPK